MGAYSIETIINALQNIKKNIPEFEKQVAEQVAPIVANEFKNIFDECIKAYYTAYSPKYYVRTLRQKLGDAGNLIETVRGVGYRIGA